MTTPTASFSRPLWPGALPWAFALARRSADCSGGLSVHSDYLGSARKTKGQPGPAEDLHAAVVILNGDREGLERLCRYVLRPPLARTRLHRRPDGLLVLTLRKPYANGTTDFIFSEGNIPMARMGDSGPAEVCSGAFLRWMDSHASVADASPFTPSFARLQPSTYSGASNAPRNAKHEGHHCPSSRPPEPPSYRCVGVQTRVCTWRPALAPLAHKH